MCILLVENTAPKYSEPFRPVIESSQICRASTVLIRQLLVLGARQMITIENTIFHLQTFGPNSTRHCQSDSNAL